MSEQSEGQPQSENILSYVIEGRNGERFPAKLFKLDEPIGQLPNSEIAAISPQIQDVARRSFTHWTDDGARFAKVLAERANRVSVVYDTKGENIVAFNVYEQGEVTPEGSELPVDFVYTHYAGVDPQLGADGESFRGQGLMEGSRTNDTRTLNPDVISGCTANGAILKGVRSTAQKLGRIMYPDVGQPVPTSVWNLGKSIYSKVNGEAAGKTVDATLVRHSEGPYLRGTAPDPLVNSLPTHNDAILYTSLSKGFAAQINSSPILTK